MAIWDDIIPESDKRKFAKAGMGGTLGMKGTLGFGERPAVVVCDMTYAYADSRYPLGSSEVGQPTARAIRRLLEAARGRRVPIFFTTVPDRILPAQHGHGWKPRNYPTDPDRPHHGQILEELRPLEGEAVIPKPRSSSFFGTNLVAMLIFQQVDTLIVTGIATSGAVRATVVDAFSHNYRVFVPEECCGDMAVVSHKVSLFDMHMKCADVLPLDAVLEYLAGLPVR